MAWKEKHDGYVEIYIKRWKYWKRCDRETKSHQKRFYHERGRSRLLSLTGCGWKLVSGMDWAGEWCGALLDLYSFKHWSPGRHSPRWESCQSWNPEWVAVSKSHNLDLQFSIQSDQARPPCAWRGSSHRWCPAGWTRSPSLKSWSSSSFSPPRSPS